MNIPRNSNQVSEANATRYFPSNILEPFGVIGIPKLQDYRNTVWRGLKEYAKRCSDSLEYQYRIMRPKHIAMAFEIVAENMGATDVTIEFRDFSNSREPQHMYIIRLKIGNRRQGFPVPLPAPRY